MFLSIYLSCLIIFIIMRFDIFCFLSHRDVNAGLLILEIFNYIHLIIASGFSYNCTFGSFDFVFFRGQYPFRLVFFIWVILYFILRIWIFFATNWSFFYLLIVILYLLEQILKLLILLSTFDYLYLIFKILHKLFVKYLVPLINGHLVILNSIFNSKNLKSPFFVIYMLPYFLHVSNLIFLF